MTPARHLVIQIFMVKFFISNPHTAINFYPKLQHAPLPPGRLRLDPFGSYYYLTLAVFSPTSDLVKEALSCLVCRVPELSGF